MTAPATSVESLPALAASAIWFALVRNLAYAGLLHLVASILHIGLYPASPTFVEAMLAVVATLHFIRKGDFSDTLKIVGLLLYDKHYLMHKATGWMLRQVDKRDAKAEEAFLAKHCREMPRTMLRYAIERFQEQKRKAGK